MVSFPNCKINLGLHILGKRADGFHNLETVFYPVPWKDALEIVSLADRETDLEYTGTGLPVAGKPENNLCVKAYHLLKKDFPQLPAVKIHLHKVIPMGAGLGGGSADAAFMLKLINNTFNLNLTTAQLLSYALQLGSDCPFFIINKPCFATGRGEILEAAAVELSTYKIVLINPGIQINTGWAFSNIVPATPKKSVKEIIQQPVESWREALKNDFEEPVFLAHPRVKAIKQALYNQGAIYAAMSGSGSTLFGIFNKDAAFTAPKEADYFIKIIN